MLNEGLVQGNIIILRFWRSRNGVLWITAIAREYWGVLLSAGNCPEKRNQTEYCNAFLHLITSYYVHASGC